MAAPEAAAVGKQVQVGDGAQLCAGLATEGASSQRTHHCTDGTPGGCPRCTGPGTHDGADLSSSPCAEGAATSTSEKTGKATRLAAAPPLLNTGRAAVGAR